MLIRWLDFRKQTLEGNLRMLTELHHQTSFSKICNNIQRFLFQYNTFIKKAYWLKIYNFSFKAQYVPTRSKFVNIYLILSVFLNSKFSTKTFNGIHLRSMLFNLSNIVMSYSRLQKKKKHDTYIWVYEFPKFWYFRVTKKKQFFTNNSKFFKEFFF